MQCVHLRNEVFCLVLAGQGGSNLYPNRLQSASQRDVRRDERAHLLECADELIVRGRADLP